MLKQKACIQKPYYFIFSILLHYFYSSPTILFQIFEEWCGSEANMIIMPGYCVAGTVGHKILNGTRTLDRPGKAGKLEVKMSVQYMSFSAHADAKGIMQVWPWPVTKLSFLHGRNRTTKKKRTSNYLRRRKF